MLPAHGYPELRKYRHLKGNFGTAWQNQQKEFANVPATDIIYNKLFNATKGQLFGQSVYNRSCIIS